MEIDATIVERVCTHEAEFRATIFANERSRSQLRGVPTLAALPPSSPVARTRAVPLDYKEVLTP